MLEEKDKKRNEINKRIKHTLVINCINKEEWDKLENTLKKNKIISTLDSPTNRQESVTKTMIGNTFTNKMKITTEEWKQMKVLKIHRNTSNDVILTFEESNHVGFVFLK